MSMQEQKSIQEQPDELSPAEREAVEALLAVKTDEELSDVLCKVERTLFDEAEKEAIEAFNKQESPSRMSVLEIAVAGTVIVAICLGLAIHSALTNYLRKKDHGQE